MHSLMGNYDKDPWELQRQRIVEEHRALRNYMDSKNINKEPWCASDIEKKNSRLAGMQLADVSDPDFREIPARLRLILECWQRLKMLMPSKYAIQDPIHESTILALEHVEGMLLGWITMNEEYHSKRKDNKNE